MIDSLLCKKMSSVTPQGLNAFIDAYVTLLDIMPNHYAVDDSSNTIRDALRRGISSRYPNITPAEMKTLLKKSGIDSSDFDALRRAPARNRREIQEDEVEFNRAAKREGYKDIPPMPFTKIFAATDPEFIRYYAKRAPEFMAEYLKEASSHPEKIVTEWGDPKDDFRYTNIFEKQLRRAQKKKDIGKLSLDDFYKEYDSMERYLDYLHQQDFEQNGIESTVGVRTPGEQNALKVKYLKPGRRYKRDWEVERELDYTDDEKELAAPSAKRAKSAITEATGRGMKKKKTRKFCV